LKGLSVIGCRLGVLADGFYSLRQAQDDKNGWPRIFLFSVMGFMYGSVLLLNLKIHWIATQFHFQWG